MFQLLIQAAAFALSTPQGWEAFQTAAKRAIRNITGETFYDYITASAEQQKINLSKYGLSVAEFNEALLAYLIDKSGLTTDPVFEATWLLLASLANDSLVPAQWWAEFFSFEAKAGDENLVLKLRSINPNEVADRISAWSESERYKGRQMHLGFITAKYQDALEGGTLLALLLKDD